MHIASQQLIIYQQTQENRKKEKKKKKELAYRERERERAMKRRELWVVREGESLQQNWSNSQ